MSSSQDQAETSPLLGQQPSSPSQGPGPDAEPETGSGSESAPGITTRLCISHFLSAWNSRLFEFGAVLFLASIYPGTLLPVSVYALVRAGAAIVLSPAVGALVDGGDRLSVVRASIVGERAAIGLSCGVFLVMMERNKGGDKNTDGGSWGLFAVTVVLAGVEKLCSIMNTVAVKRDWVVEITEGDDMARITLNAQMRRIDLACKLFSPLLIATIDSFSTSIAIWTTLAMTCVSVPTEYLFIKQVYNRIPRLQHRKQRSGQPSSLVRSIVRHAVLPVTSARLYARSAAFLPSLSYALLHLTVLSFSGRMIAFLLAEGYTPWHVGLARLVSTVAELSATWASPRLMARVGCVRAGGWSVTWQMVWLTAGAAVYLALGVRGTLGGADNGTWGVTGLVIGVIMSRIGLWGFELAVSNIIQDRVESDDRGAFSTTEASVQNVFEMLSYISTMIFARPDEFQWPVFMTMVSGYLACVVYFIFMGRQKGPDIITEERV